MHRARIAALPSSGETADEIRRLLLGAAGDRVVAIILHGSRATGAARTRSDWDIVVVLRDPVDDWIDEGLRLGALFYDHPFAVDLQVFGECEFRQDVAVPGTLAYAVSRRGELGAEEIVECCPFHKDNSTGC